MAGLTNFTPAQEHQAANSKMKQVKRQLFQYFNPPDLIASQQGDVILLECLTRAVIEHPQAELIVLNNAITDMKVEIFESCNMCTLALAKRRFSSYSFSSHISIIRISFQFMT